MNTLKHYKDTHNLREAMFFCVCELARKKCKDNDQCNNDVPHHDHQRVFVDKQTGERVYTIQPYIDHDNLTRPRTVEIIAADSEEFAKAHGLSVRVSTEDSWYSQPPNPHQTVLVEFRRARTTRELLMKLQYERMHRVN